MVEQHRWASDLAVCDLRPKADALQRHLIDGRDLLGLELVALDGGRAVGCGRAAVVGIELEASRLHVTVGRISVTLRGKRGRLMIAALAGAGGRARYLLELQRVQRGNRGRGHS